MSVKRRAISRAIGVTARTTDATARTIVRAVIWALAVSICLLTACTPASQQGQAEGTPAPTISAQPIETPLPALNKDTIRIGVLYAHGQNKQAATNTQEQGAQTMFDVLGIKGNGYYPKFNVSPEGQAVIRGALLELTEEGCHIIFGTHPAYAAAMAQMAREYPEIEFCVAGGEADGGALPANYHTYYAKIHQGRYLTGIAAGMKTQTDHIGYIATMPDANNISAFSAFYLGAKSVNPEIVMDVIYTDTLSGGEKELLAAQALIDEGADVLAEQAEGGSEIALLAQAQGVWHIAYGADMHTIAPRASLIGTGIDWSVYMRYAVQCMFDEEPIASDWSGGLSEGAVMLFEINAAEAAMGSWEAIADTKASLEADALYVFSGALKTAEGEAAAITYPDGTMLFQFTDEQSVYIESSESSAPQFNVLVAGITVKSLSEHATE